MAVLRGGGSGGGSSGGRRASVSVLAVMAIMALLSLAEAGGWQQCKQQCDNNFTSEDIIEHPELVSVCQRGCEIFTVALISTPVGGVPLSGVNVRTIPDARITLSGGMPLFGVGIPLSTGISVSSHGSSAAIQFIPDIIKMFNKRKLENLKNSPASNKDKHTDKHAEFEETNNLVEAVHKHEQRGTHWEKAMKQKKELEKKIVDQMESIGRNKKENNIIEMLTQKNITLVKDSLMKENASIKNVKETEHKPVTKETVITNKNTVSIRIGDVHKDLANVNPFKLTVQKGMPNTNEEKKEDKNAKVAKPKDNENSDQLKTEIHVAPHNLVFTTVTGDKAREILEAARSHEKRDQNPPKKVENKEKPRNTISKSTKGNTQSSVSKTTVQPVPHPVQDHPVHANRQITTDSSGQDERKTTTPQTSNPVAPINHGIQEFRAISRIASQLSPFGVGNIHPFLRLGFAKLQPSMNLVMPRQISIIEIVKKKNNIDFDKLHEEHIKKAIHWPKIRERIEEAHHSCRHCCISVYNFQHEQDACVMGCQNQAISTNKVIPKRNNNVKHGVLSSGGFNIHGFSLFGLKPDMMKINPNKHSMMNFKIGGIGPNGFKQEMVIAFKTGLMKHDGFKQIKLEEFKTEILKPEMMKPDVINSDNLKIEWLAPNKLKLDLKGAVTSPLDQQQMTSNSFMEMVSSMFTNVANQIGKSVNTAWTYVTAGKKHAEADGQVTVSKAVPMFPDIIQMFKGSKSSRDSNDLKDSENSKHSKDSNGSKDSKALGGLAPHIGIKLLFRDMNEMPMGERLSERIINTESVFQFVPRHNPSQPQHFEMQVLEEQLEHHQFLMDARNQGNDMISKLEDRMDQLLENINPLNKLQIMGDHLNEERNEFALRPGLGLPKFIESLFHQDITLDHPLPNIHKNKFKTLEQILNEEFGDHSKTIKKTNYGKKTEHTVTHQIISGDINGREINSKIIITDSIIDGTNTKKETSNDKTSNNSILHMDIQQLDLLECISRKSGLPRWLIASTILVSALGVFWLCLSLTSPVEDAKMNKSKNNVLGCVFDEVEDDYHDPRIEKNALPNTKFVAISDKAVLADDAFVAVSDTNKLISQNTYFTISVEKV